MKFNIILAVDKKNGIGKNGKLAWHISKDLQYFKSITLKTIGEGKINALIMGKNTWESLPKLYRPLKNRLNCVLSKNLNENDYNILNNNVLFFRSFDDCINTIGKDYNIENIFIIGGASLYNKYINDVNLDKIYLTKIYGDFDCDVFFNGFSEEDFILEYKSGIKEENGLKFEFCIYGRKK